MMAKYSAFWEHSRQVNDIKKIALSKAVFDGFLTAEVWPTAGRLKRNDPAFEGNLTVRYQYPRQIQQM